MAELKSPRVAPAFQHKSASLLSIGDLFAELGVLDGTEDLSENGTGRIPHSDEVLTGQQW